MDGGALIIVVFAFAAGGAVGQWFAELRRAQYDARRAWRQRKDYRK